MPKSRVAELLSLISAGQQSNWLFDSDPRIALMMRQVIRFDKRAVMGRWGWKATPIQPLVTSQSLAVLCRSGALSLLAQISHLSRRCVRDRFNFVVKGGQNGLGTREGD